MVTLATVVLGALTVSVSTQMVITAVVAFIVGMVIAFLLVTPAKSRSDYIVRGHAQRARMLEQQIGEQQNRNDLLQEQNSSLLAERNHLRGQLDALREHNLAVASRGNPDGDGAVPVDQTQQREQDRASEREQDQVRARESEQDQGDQQAAADRQAQTDQEPQPQPQQESFGERIKGFFSGNNPDNTDNTADNTNAPTPSATS